MSRTPFGSLPYSCPICNRLTLRPLFEEVRLTAELDHDLRNVGGLAAFMCADNGHIFFVRKQDLDAQTSSERASTGS